MREITERYKTSMARIRFAGGSREEILSVVKKLKESHQILEQDGNDQRVYELEFACILQSCSNIIELVYHTIRVSTEPKEDRLAIAHFNRDIATILEEANDMFVVENSKARFKAIEASGAFIEAFK